MPFIPLIVAGVSAAATVYAAKKQASAAKEAAATQSAAGDKALTLQKDLWQQQQANLQPWLTQGGKAVNTLGYLMGLGGTGDGAQAPTTTPTPSQATRGPLSAWDTMSPEERAYVSSPTTRRGIKNYLYDPENNPDPSQGGIFAPGGTSQAAAEARSQSSYVTMQAPDGSTEQIPSQHVGHYTSLGARVVA